MGNKIKVWIFYHIPIFLNAEFCNRLNRSENKKSSVVDSNVSRLSTLMVCFVLLKALLRNGPILMLSTFS